MTIFSRSTLKEAFPKNERAVREFEKLDRALSDVDDNGKTISERVADLDALDPASLITRGVGYTVFMGLGGKGTTAQRPTVPVNTISIYLDTTLDPDGQPIIWNGSYWVNFSGAPV
jgi:hypothetical protein